MLALGQGLRRRGCAVTLATSRYYRETVERAGLAFHALRPEPDMDDTQVFRELFDPRRGSERLIRRYLLPYARHSFEDLRAIPQPVDFLVNSPIVYAGPVWAETQGIPWASVGLQPFLYFSAFDAPVVPMLPVTGHWHDWPLLLRQGLLTLMRRMTDGWPQTVYALRRELGLSRGRNPIFEGQFSPWLNLALFSPVLGARQPDWPPNTHVTGFAFHDEDPDGVLPEALSNFLAAGEPPVVFTLGSSAVKTAGRFYEEALEAVRRLKCRALFLAGKNRPPVPANMDAKRVLFQEYAPYSRLFPHAAAVVHQGGVGTTAETLRAGKPMVIVPYGFDQPDNAARMRRLGVSRTVPRNACTAHRLAEALDALLQNPSHACRAETLGETIRLEDGVAEACRLILSVS